MVDAQVKKENMRMFGVATPGFRIQLTRVTFPNSTKHLLSSIAEVIRMGKTVPQGMVFGSYLCK